jgi:hypothetical protein
LAAKGLYVIPAMAAGVGDHMWSLAESVEMVEAHDFAET